MFLRLEREKSAFVRSLLVKLPLERLVLVIIIPVNFFASRIVDKSSTSKIVPEKFAFVRSASLNTAFARFAFVRFAFVRFAFVRFAYARVAFVRSVLERSVLERSAPGPISSGDGTLC